ncbi:hypothetical protein ACFFX0_13010 [Citricoccus parietis]|uniref:Uncharacterized protein n=1 Tax=Citricoccus parietis TaxID=592307 RepID=A0ABV5FZG2_9MICC
MVTEDLGTAGDVADQDDHPDDRESGDDLQHRHPLPLRFRP